METPDLWDGGQIGMVQTPLTPASAMLSQEVRPYHLLPNPGPVDQSYTTKGLHRYTLCHNDYSWTFDQRTHLTDNQLVASGGARLLELCYAAMAVGGHQGRGPQ